MSINICGRFTFGKSIIDIYLCLTDVVHPYSFHPVEFDSFNSYTLLSLFNNKNTVIHYSTDSPRSYDLIWWYHSTCPFVILLIILGWVTLHDNFDYWILLSLFCCYDESSYTVNCNLLHDFLNQTTWNTSGLVFLVD